MHFSDHFKIGLRYVSSQPQSQLVAFISRISIFGLALGVALLILVLSVMNGFDREMRERILELVPQVTIHARGDQVEWEPVEQLLANEPSVIAAAPNSQLPAMILQGNEVKSAMLYGVDPKAELSVSIIDEFVDAKLLQQLATQPQQAIVGNGLAEKLGLAAGDKLKLMIPHSDNMGRIKPSFEMFKISGTFATGTEIDQRLILASIDQVSAISPQPIKNRALRLKVDDVFNAGQYAWQLQYQLPAGFYVSDWTKTYGNLYSAIQLSRQLVGMMLISIIAVAVFNVVAALVMIVNDKHGDIAILKTYGASPMDIVKIFMVQGGLIGVIGTFFGVVFGIALTLLLPKLVLLIEGLLDIKVLSSEIYPVDYVPVAIQASDVLLIAGTALFMSLIATIYPAWRAAKVMPADALRHEI